MQLTIDISITRYFTAFAAIMICRNIAEHFFKPKVTGRDKPGPADKMTLLMFLLSYLISALAAGIFLLTDKNTALIPFLIGLVVIAAGFAGRIIALRKISSSYSQLMTPDKQAALITDGVYSRIRHPLYLFYAMEMLGLLLIRFNWISLAMLAVDLVNTVYRIRREEILLDQRYGSRYREYCRTTKRLIPFIF